MTKLTIRGLVCGVGELHGDRTDVVEIALDRAAPFFGVPPYLKIPVTREAAIEWAAHFGQSVLIEISAPMAKNGAGE